MQSVELTSNDSQAQSAPGILQKLRAIDKMPMALAFGGMLGLSTAGFDIWWLAWIGLAPLLVLALSMQSKTQSFVIGLVFGLGYYLVAFSWYLGLYPLRWLGVEDWLGFQIALSGWLVESLHHALLIALFALLVYALPMRSGFWVFFKRPYYPFLLSVPLIWIFLNWVIAPASFFLGTPYCQLAYSQVSRLNLLQLVAWGGSQTLDFLLVMLNAAVAGLFITVTGWVQPMGDRVDRLSPRGGALVDLALILLFMGCVTIWGRSQLIAKGENSQLVYKDNTPGALLERHVPLAVIQPNIRAEETSGSLTDRELADRYYQLGSNKGVALEVMPEGLFKEGRVDAFQILGRLKEIAGLERKEVVTGAVDQTDAGFANAAVLLSPDQESFESYYIKRRLKPFAEYIPFGGEHIPADMRKWLTGFKYGYLPGHRARLLNSIWGKVGVSIADELIYPKLIAREVRNGASLLVNVANFSWFHESKLMNQVLAAAVFRAVENGRFVVLSTNTGISAVIHPSGIVVGRSLPERKGVLVDTVQFLYKRTPYTKMWWL